jgi:hypothetical protein
MRRLAALALLLPVLPLAGADSAADKINARAQQYEADMDKAYAASSPRLEAWVKEERDRAVGSMRGLMQSSADSDKLFVAYRVLRLEPKDAAARAVFTEAKVDAPIDESGAERALQLPKAVDPALAERVANLEYPSQEAVRNATLSTSPMVQSYWKAEADAMPPLKQDLLALKAQGRSDLAMQTLAYYWPTSKDVKKWEAAIGRNPMKDQWWIDPVDQFLVDHDLVVWDCLLVAPKAMPALHKGADGSYALAQASWEFHATRNLRLESIVAPGKNNWPSFSFTDDKGRGVRVAVTGANEITAQAVPPTKEPVGKATLPFETTGGPFLLELDARGTKIVVRAGGVPVIVGDLAKPCAFHRFSTEGSCAARLLHVRFLGSAAASSAIKVVEWPAERKKELDKLVTVEFSDTSVDEVVAFLARVSGVKISLDDSGQLLKDLPVTLSAKDMKLDTALKTLERLTDLHATPTADGITLSWKK